MRAEDVSRFLGEVFPQMSLDGRPYRIQSVGAGEAVLSFDPGERHLRPGETVSGPALFTLADYASYAAVLAHIGPVPLAVTTSLNMTFMRRASRGRLIGTAHLLKLGRSLAVLDVGITADGGGELIAHAVATFSLPPGVRQL